MSLTKLNDNGHFPKEQFDRNVKKNVKTKNGQIKP